MRTHFHEMTGGLDQWSSRWVRRSDNTDMPSVWDYFVNTFLNPVKRGVHSLKAPFLYDLWQVHGLSNFFSLSLLDVLNQYLVWSIPSLLSCYYFLFL